jgi:hypothetical protein
MMMDVYSLQERWDEYGSEKNYLFELKPPFLSEMSYMIYTFVASLNELLTELWRNNESRRHIRSFGKGKGAVTRKGGFSGPMFILISFIILLFRSRVYISARSLSCSVYIAFLSSSSRLRRDLENFNKKYFRGCEFGDKENSSVNNVQAVEVEGL